MLSNASIEDTIVAVISSVDESQVYLTIEKYVSTSEEELDIVWTNNDYCSSPLTVGKLDNYYYLQV